MRQAVDQTDDWMYYRVELDGQPIDYVIEADDEAGYVIILDPDNARRGEPAERRIEGRVALIDTRAEATKGEGRVKSLGGDADS